jgi:hypothetical protein
VFSPQQNRWPSQALPKLLTENIYVEINFQEKKEFYHDTLNMKNQAKLILN